MAIPLVVLLLHEVWTMQVPGLVGGDFAVNNVATRSALHLKRFLGPYSRFGWNHPGPAIYYWSAPLFAASGERYGGLTASAALLNLLLAVGIVAVVGRLGSRRDALAAGSVMMLFLSFGDFERWRSAWNPDLIVLPVAAVVILAAALIGGRRWSLWLLAVVASLAVQTHVGSLVVVAAVVVVAIAISAWLERRDTRRWRWPLVWMVLALGVLWVLPIYEQFTRTPGNLTLLWRFYGDAPAPQVSIAQALRFVVGQGTLTWVPGPSFGVVTAGPALTWWRWAMLVAIIVLAVGGCIVAWRRNDRFVAALRGLPVVGLAAAFVTVIRVPGSFANYLTTYVLSVGLCLWIGAASTIAELLGTGIRLISARPAVDREVVRALRTAAALAAAGALLVGGAAMAWSWRSARPVGTQLNVAATEQIYSAVSSRVGSHQTVVIAMRGLAWEYAGGAIDGLERAGHPVRVNTGFVFMFGDDHGPRDEPAARFLVTSPGLGPLESGLIPIPLPPATTSVQLYEIPSSVAFPGI